MEKKYIFQFAGSTTFPISTKASFILKVSPPLHAINHSQKPRKMTQVIQTDNWLCVSQQSDWPLTLLAIY